MLTDFLENVIFDECIVITLLGRGDYLNQGKMV